MSPAKHSFVIPVFNEEASLTELHRRIRDSLGKPLQNQGDDYEIVFVDDGSRDRSRALIEELHRQDPARVKLVAFSRNFGHQVAVTAGIDFASGDTVTLLDADLQDPPEVVLEMVEKWRQGFDVVYGVRAKRQAESLFKKATAHFFYRLLRTSTQLDIPVDTGDFRLMSRKAANALRQLPERHRFVRGLSRWIGFRQTEVTYVREARFAGETKYPLKKMLRLAWDAFTGFSLAPLRVATYVGLFASAVSLIIAFWALYVRFFSNQAVQGWTSLMIAILFLGGVQLFTIGILGEYVGRIFEESKGRPLYVVDELLGIEGAAPPLK